MLKLEFTPFPVIETDNLVLRNLNEQDREDVFAIRGDKETMQHIFRPLAKTLEDADGVINMILGFTDRNERINWAITQKGNDKLIGVIGYVKFNSDNFRSEVGYVLNKQYWGSGITGEALKAVCNYGYKTIGLHSIEALVRPENKASIRLLEKTGFIKEAYFKDYFFNGEKFFDAEVHSLLQSYL